MYTMEKELTNKKFLAAYRHLQLRVKNHPEKNFFVVVCAAGHGMTKGAELQILLTNEFDP